jgi:putative phage-type endonuclease
MSLSPEQRTMRRAGISGSDVAALCGISPFRTPLDVWKEKVLGENTEETLPQEIGNALEAGILSLYARRKKVLALKMGTTLRHPRYPLVLATPDAIHPDGFPVEAKAAASFTAFEDFGDDGTDEVPEHYRCQLLWQMAVLGAPHADLVALLSGRDVRIYRVPWDEEYFEALRVIAERFFQEHIATEKPPDPDGSETWAQFIKERFPAERGPVLAADHDCEKLVADYFRADMLLEAAELQKNLARQQLELRLGEAAGMAGDGWKLSWKATKPIRKVDWEAAARQLGCTDEIAEGFTSVKPGYRPFRLTRLKQKAVRLDTATELP